MAKMCDILESLFCSIRAIHIFNLFGMKFSETENIMRHTLGRFCAFGTCMFTPFIDSKRFFPQTKKKKIFFGFILYDYVM